MWKTSPPPHTRSMHTHTCTHTCTHTHTSNYVDGTSFPIRSYDTQNCSPVARPCFPSLSEHTAWNKMQLESRATPPLHELKSSITKITILVFYCYVTQIKNSDLELLDVACRLSNKATARRMNTKHYLYRLILIFSPPTHELYRKGVETN